jgi:three-Cys-motif partner protein
MKTDDFDWMKKYLQKLTDIGKEVKDDDITTDYGCYTALKLVSIYYYSEVFTNVAMHPNRMQQGFDGAVYIDLFAGSGLVKFTDTGDYVAGSPICAASNKNSFNYLLCVELDPKKKKALETRLAKVISRDKFDVIQGDCNTCVDDVISKINEKFKRPIVCTFVDPEGMEIKWSTLEKLSKAFLSMDFVVNVSSQGVARVRGKLEKGIQSVEKSMSEYYDEDAQTILFDLASGKTPEAKYQDKIQKVLGKVVGDNITIRDQGNRVAYYILGYTRQTSGGAGYASSFSTLKRRIEWADRDKVKNILDQMHGRVGRLFG